jgi:hypothetical protein
MSFNAASSASLPQIHYCGTVTVYYGSGSATLPGFYSVRGCCFDFGIVSQTL